MRTHSDRVAGPLAGLFLVLVTVSIAHATPLYMGRAVGVLVKTSTQATPTLHADTGELRPEGGELIVAMEELIVGGDVLRATGVTAWTQGSTGSTRGTSELANVRAYEGQAAQLIATRVAVEASAGCDGVRGSTVIVGLEFGGRAIRVTGMPNQKETIPGVGTLVINEHVQLGRTRDLTVRGLHLTLESGEQVIVGSVRAGLECVVAVEPRLWQDVKQRYRN
jgi:hypothetical protein